MGFVLIDLQTDKKAAPPLPLKAYSTEQLKQEIKRRRKIQIATR